MAYTALYNLYRPHSFGDVIGQRAVVETLSGQVSAKRVSHAYLFSGPRGIGKTTLARIFAKAINCMDPQNGEACEKCATCKALSEKNNLDIIEIDAASNTGVNDIRTLRENVKYMPAAGKYRVYIIDEVHMLSTNAFNALLKTLEEPPEHIVFIMATTEPHKLPVTVLSRCQRFEFTRISTKLITDYLEKLTREMQVKADKDALAAIARASSGGMRDALSLLDQMLAIGDSNIDVNLVSQMLGSADKLLYFALCDAILKEDISRSLKGLSQMIEKGCSVSTIATDLMQMFRDIYIAQNTKNIAEDLMTDEASAQRYAMIAKRVSSGTVLKCLEIFSMLENDLRYSSCPEVRLELAIAKACRVQKEESYQALLERVERLEKSMVNGAIPKKQNQADAVQQEREEFFPVKDTDFTELSSDEDDMPFGGTVLQQEELPAKEQEDVHDNAIVDEKKQKSSDTTSSEAKQLWTKAIQALRAQKQMVLVSAMGKAVVENFDGKTMHVGFHSSDNVCIKRVNEKEYREILEKTISEIHESKISVIAKELTTDEKSKEIIDNLYAHFPSSLISMNEDEDN